jgi:ADP-heptose:LPS heptosyltransferase
VVQRLLVLRALGLGDLLTAVPALRALRRHFPGHHVTVAAPAAFEPLLQLTGAVDEVADTAPLTPLPEHLGGADLAVNLHGRGPESTALLLASEPRRLIAFHHDAIPVTFDGPDWQPGEHEVARWCRLLEHYGIPADPTELALPAPPVSLPLALRGATVVHPGAADAARRWPPERWAAVAMRERANQRQVVVTGSASEIPLARRVATIAGLPDDAVLAGRTDLVTLAAIIAGAGRVVCGDTGVAHLATAFGTPSVVLFGPVPPSEWGPPPGPHRAIWKGRRGDPHGTEVDEGLLAISVADVQRELDALPDVTVTPR